MLPSHSYRRWAEIVLVVAFLWLAWLGACHPVTRPSTPKLREHRDLRLVKPCARIPQHTVQGWIDRWEGDCAVIWVSSRHPLLQLHRDSLPKHAQEGDYLSHGVILPLRRQQLTQDIRQLISQRPNLLKPTLVPVKHQPPKKNPNRKHLKHPNIHWQRILIP